MTGDWPTVGNVMSAADAERRNAEHPLAGILRLTVEAVVTHPDGTTDEESK